MKLAERACDLAGSQIAEKIASLKKIEERNIKKLLAWMTPGLILTFTPK